MSDSFHVYLNLDVFNNCSNADKALIFSETRTIPFLENSFDYFLTVARFNLQSSNNFPIFIPDIEVGQSDYNKTVYKIRFEVTKTLGATTEVLGLTASIPYRSFDKTIPTPSAPINGVDRSSTFYWVYNVSDWVDMINDTLLGLMNSISSAIGVVPALNAPYVQYDLTTGLFTLSVDKVAINSYKLKIFFNARLYNILPFPSELQQTSLFTPSEPTYKITLRSDLGSTTVYILNSMQVDFLQTRTEFSPLSLLNPVRTILFSTTHLPVQPQLSQSPIIYTDSVPTGTTNNLPDITNMLTDFEISVTATNSYNGEITYLPQSEYRWIDLNPAISLNKIDVKAFWRDKFGNIHTIYLPPGCCASIKLLFRKKSYYLGWQF